MPTESLDKKRNINSTLSTSKKNKIKHSEAAIVKKEFEFDSESEEVESEESEESEVEGKKLLWGCVGEGVGGVSMYLCL